MRTYYTDYVRHALRFYSRNCATRPSFRNEVDKQNWLSCDSVLSKLNEDTAKMLIEIYAGHDTLADEVYGASKRWDMEQGRIWDYMKDVEQRIARRRGLI